MNVSTLVGQIGEYSVCIDLLKKGYRAFLSAEGLPFDVVVVTDAGKLIKIQVKSTKNKIITKKQKKSCWSYDIRRGYKEDGREYKKEDTDYFALVAIDINKIAYIPFDIATKNKIINLPSPESFDIYPFEAI